MAAMENKNSYYFDKYTDLGWEIIPIKPNSKIPVQKHWNWTYDRERAKKVFNKNPDCNLGLLLGQIVDVEGDDEESNQIIETATKDYPHPKFMSNRSVHHLFQNEGILTTKIQSVEFRSFKHQSIVPPSTHICGKSYSWLDTNNFILPPIPEELLKLYNGAQKTEPKIIKFVDFVKPTCILCKKKRKVHRVRFNLEIEAFNAVGLKWSCRECRQIDLRPICRFLRLSL